MVLSLLMTILGSLGRSSLPPKLKLIMCLKDSSMLFRMRRTAVFHQLNLIMRENFKMRSLTDSAVNWALHNFSAVRTPQQNGVVERKNRSLEELVRTMMNENKLPKYFWADAVSTACYVLNRVLIRPILKKTPYELLKGRKPNVSHLKVFWL